MAQIVGIRLRSTIRVFSKNPHKRNNRESNKKKYDYTQEQRRRERDIRKQKRIIAALEKAKTATLDLELKKELQAEINAQKQKLREQRKEYNAFCDKHNLKRQAIRTYTYEEK